MGYIPKHALENLNKYQYRSVDKSILSRYVLNPYWNQLVKLWPTSVAPNTITLTGLSLVFLNFLTMLYYDPSYYTAKHASGPPQWIYFTWAAGLFLYQSLDAIDGKQARRTQMAGPLGEMFDHGCDAINTTLEAILACYALNLGRSWWTVSSQVATLANFYLTTWEEFHTGQLYLGVFSGPVEGILLIVGIYIITGVYGPAFWDQGTLTFLRLEHLDHIADIVPNVPLNEVFMYFGGFGLAFNIVTSYTNVHRATRSSPSSSFRPFLRLLPFPLSVAIHFAHQVGRMILAHLTQRRDMPFWEWLWVVSALAGLDANAPRLFGRPPFFQDSYERIALAVYASLLLSFVAYARFCYLVIGDITDFLGIACFTVRKKGIDGAWHSAIPGAPTDPKLASAKKGKSE
ncbi:CDP-alcohol phosphatidyltransferase-domain-containing protein [Phellopilus nigrolimitatus]|nr:CDP-alcohol phosphatidyltransferase-domain-containing protein [Phellopilus nigrolimitatus]